MSIILQSYVQTVINFRSFKVENSPAYSAVLFHALNNTGLFVNNLIIIFSRDQRIWELYFDEWLPFY
jgi:hypothetical protein